MVTSARPCDTLWARFEAAVARHRTRPAVSDVEETLSYGEVHIRSARIAQMLSATGVGVDEAVVVCTDRTVDSIAAALGISAVGGIYVPVDSNEPQSRFARIVSGAGAEVALVDEYGAEAAAAQGLRLVDIAECEEQEPIVSSNGPVSRIAYILFTSGSTGVPKGVEVTHDNLLALLRGADEWARSDYSDVWACFHAFTFDISLWEIWRSLTTGSQLVVLPREAQVDSKYIVSLLNEYRVTSLCQTPTAVRWLGAQIENTGPVESLRHLYICGERLDFAIMKPFYDPVVQKGLRAWNLYGPTEATIYATGHIISASDITDERRSLIGKALPHVSVAVDSPKAQGIGEIVITGDGVAAGYRGDPELTKERFIRLDGERAYKTGDLGRIAEGGEIEFVSRDGGFIKVRGYRVEPDEVTNALCLHPDVVEAGVIDSALLPGGPALVAGIVLREGASASDRDLRQHVAGVLPTYMRPTRMVALESLPRLPSAKLDRRALRQVIEQRLHEGTPWRLPSDQTSDTGSGV